MVLQNPNDVDNLIPLNYIKRRQHKDLLEHMLNPEVTILYGARQVGKSSEIAVIIKQLLEQKDKPNVFYFNMDHPSPDFKDPEIFINSILAQKISEAAKTYVFIDEAQRLVNIGLFIKYIYDKNMGVKFVLTGSAPLDIKEKIKEPLTGRKKEFVLCPMLLDEVLQHYDIDVGKISGDFDPLHKILIEYLVFGGYPYVVANKSVAQKKAKLVEIADSYIQRDVRDLFGLNDPTNTKIVAGFLAESIGNLFSLENISKLTQIPKSEVAKNVMALRKTFVISDIYPFHKNKAKELAHRPKVYYNDLGIRNALLNKLEESVLMTDKGKLFENALAIQLTNLYGIQNVKFWRTINQTELDFVIETPSSKLLAYETKFAWDKRKIARNVKSFEKVYKDVLETASIISADNYWKVFNP